MCKHSLFDKNPFALLAFLFLLCLLPFTPAGGVDAATIEVTNLNDSGAGSLRQALLDAASGDVINISPTGTITLSTGELNVGTDVTIDGPGMDDLVLDGDDASRVFNISGSSTVALQDLTIANGRDAEGYTFGGCVYADGGELSLTNVRVSQCRALSDNAGYAHGGGISSSGDLELDACVIENNAAEGGDPLHGSGDGGRVSGSGIYLDGTLTASNTVIRNNQGLGGDSVDGYGGIAYGGGVMAATINLTDCVVQGNNVTAGSGVGGKNSSWGGGLFASVGLSLERCLIEGNSASGDGGNGGGVHIDSDASPILVKNTTIANNTADVGAGMRLGTFAGTVEHQFVNCTIVNNSGTDYGGGLFVNEDGGSTMSVVLKNTILYGNTANLGPDLYNWLNDVDVRSDGYNILSSTGGAPNDGGINDILDQDPDLSPLADNGGLSQTMAPNAGSPALGAAAGADPDGGAVERDQRKVLRPQNGDYDIGAYQSPKSFTLSVSRDGDGNGTVTTNTGGVDCGSDCSDTVEGGDVVILSATPASGSSFLGWSGADNYCTGTGDCELTMDQAYAITATFHPPEINVSGNGVNIVDGDDSPSLADHTDFGTSEMHVGSVTRTFTIENLGQGTLTLSGSPMVELAAGTHFTVNDQPGAGILDNSQTTTFQITFAPTASGTFTDTVSIANDDGDENPYTFAIEGDGEAYYDLDASLSGNGGVTSDDGGIDCPGDCTESYKEQTEVTLTADPDDGWAFDAWTGCHNADGVICVMTMTADAGVQATFIIAVAAPDATTTAATDVGSTSATLNGTVNANNDSTTVTFEYGAGTNYGTTVTADQSPVTGATDTAVSAGLTGLTPNTTYHYRAVGQNTAGTTNGADMTFTTGDDNDGVTAGEEDGVTNPGGSGTGDGNGDGTPDKKQSNVTSLQTSDNTGYATLDCSATSGSALQNVAAVDPASTDAPADYPFPFGMFSFDVTNIADGASITMEIYVDRDTSIVGYLKKNQNTNAWENVADSIDHTSVAGKTVITITLVDGGPYDTDGSANGSISDPGGPVYAKDQIIPTMGEWAMIILSLFMAGVMVTTMRRRQMI